MDFKVVKLDLLGLYECLSYAIKRPEPDYDYIYQVLFRMLSFCSDVCEGDSCAL